MMADLVAQAERMNKLGDAFTYRLVLSGLVLQSAAAPYVKR